MAIVPGFVTTLLLASAKGVAHFQAALANRRAAKALLDWDHRALKDIGLTRGDVRGALSAPFHEDPTTFLSLIAAGREPRIRRDGASRQMSSDIEPAGKARLGNLPSAESVLCA
jgi:uncharacterized protein YjiS (DUF1127 family)